MIGSTINGRYHLLAELGRGAMGVVYRAEQLDAEGQARRVVAVKTLKPEFSQDPDFARRFLREVGVSMQLRSPHALTVHDSGRDESGQLYYVMEFVAQTLKDFLQEQGQLSVERTVTIIGQLCDALAEAHSLPDPVVHRDIKPANIFVMKHRGQDWVKLGDFGIAKLLNEHTTVLTHTGQASPGTPRYMAPEQWLGQAVDGRTDLYSLGVLLYEMLRGQPPFSGPIPVLMGQHLQLPPPPLPNEIPLGVREEVERLLAKKPEDRPPDALSVRAALEAGLKNEEEQQPTIMLPRAETLSVKVDEIKTEVIEQSTRQKQETREEISGFPVSKSIQDQHEVSEGKVRSSQSLFFWRSTLAVLIVSIVGGLLFFFRLQGRETFQPQEEPKVVTVPPAVPEVTRAPPTASPQGTTDASDDMVLVPAGEFFMGCNEKVGKGCFGSDQPERQVFVDAFKIDKTEVTVAEYGQCVKAGKCSAPKTGEDCNWQQEGKESHPINCVDWNQAVAFCQWDGNKRLPTEAEWEKAARGTDGRMYPWGNTWDRMKLNAYGNADGYAQTAPVGSFSSGASPYGALDMVGNVEEWVQDWHDPEYYQNGPTKNPRGPDQGTGRGVRGGSWRSPPRDDRTTSRGWAKPGLRYEGIGMRCAQ